MTIDRLALRNFLMFTGRKTGEISAESFDEKFIPGINVFIGGNATGKTTLLKSIYGACEWSNTNNIENKAKYFRNYFSSSKSLIKDINQKEEDAIALIRAFSGKTEFHYRAWDDGILDYKKWFNLNIQSVFIPTAEMLSHSNGLVAMDAKYGIPFDGTQMDILVNAQTWETKEISDRNKEILSMISTVIDGEVIYENDIFYIVKSNGLKIEFSLEAEGFKKLGLLWKIIRNGLLERGSILLWDEPEASLNPEIIPLLVDILYILMRDGVQIFIATHNYTLAKYIDIKKSNPKETLFLSLYKNSEGGIDVSRSMDYGTLENNPIEASEERLYDAVVQKSTEGI